MTRESVLNATRCLLQLFEFLLCQLGLPQDAAEGSGGHIARVHRHVGLAAIGMAQHLVRTFSTNPARRNRASTSRAL